MGTEKSRKERIGELLKMVQEPGKDVNAKELFGHFALKYGVTFKTFWSYLKTLEITGNINNLPSLKEFKKRLGIE